MLVPIDKAEEAPLESPKKILPCAKLGKSFVLPIAVTCILPWAPVLVITPMFWIKLTPDCLSFFNLVLIFCIKFLFNDWM